MESKDPPVEVASDFLKRFGLDDGGMIRCDQGSEISWSEEFCTTMQCKYTCVIKPTGADNPAQNRGTELWNGTSAVTVRTLLYVATLLVIY